MHIFYGLAVDSTKICGSVLLSRLLLRPSRLSGMTLSFNLLNKIDLTAPPTILSSLFRTWWWMNSSVMEQGCGKSEAQIAWSALWPVLRAERRRDAL